MNREEKIQNIQRLIRSFPDYPKPGIMFRDIFPLLKNPDVFMNIIELLEERVRQLNTAVHVVVGLEARGFLFGPMLAYKLKIPFVPIRKAGKLPGETLRVEYNLEYGSAVFEIQKDALCAGQAVVIVDDLLATGGTMAAACRLVREVGCTVAECLTIVELEGLNGRQAVDAPVFSLLT